MQCKRKVRADLACIDERIENVKALSKHDTQHRRLPAVSQRVMTWKSGCEFFLMLIARNDVRQHSEHDVTRSEAPQKGSEKRQRRNDRVKEREYTGIFVTP